MKHANFRRNFVSRVYLAPMGRRHICMEGEPGAGGGGGGGGAPAGGQGGQGAGQGGGQGGQQAPTIPPELQPLVQQMIDQAVTGLKNKNGELIGKEKELKAQLAQFEGIDPQAMRALLDRFQNDEEQGLLKAGKLDEVVNKRTERLRADYEKKLKAEQDDKAKLKARADKLAERATNEAILKAATKAGALPEATEDIVLRAKGAGWTIDDEGNVVAKNGDGDVIFGKDGKTPLTPEEWAASLRENAPHLWPRAVGSGANGSNNAAKGGVDLSKLTPEARITYHRQQAMGVR